MPKISDLTSALASYTGTAFLPVEYGNTSYKVAVGLVNGLLPTGGGSGGVTLPPNADLIGSNASGQAVPLTLGSNISIVSNVLTFTYTYSPPVMSDTVAGIGKVDGTTITAAAGVISTAQQTLDGRPALSSFTDTALFPVLPAGSTQINKATATLLASYVGTKILPAGPGLIYVDASNIAHQLTLSGATFSGSTLTVPLIGPATPGSVKGGGTGYTVNGDGTLTITATGGSRGLVPPNPANFTWDNQGGASVVDNALVTGMKVPGGTATTQMRSRLAPFPAAPSTVTMRVSVLGVARSYLLGGMVVRNSTSDARRIIGITYDDQEGTGTVSQIALRVLGYISATVIGTDFFEQHGFPSPTFHVKICKDATNMSYLLSFDGGCSFGDPIYQEARSTFDPDEYGIGIDWEDSHTTGIPAQVTCSDLDVLATASPTASVTHPF